MVSRPGSTVCQESVSLIFHDRIRPGDWVVSFTDFSLISIWPRYEIQGAIGAKRASLLGPGITVTKIALVIAIFVPRGTHFNEDVVFLLDSVTQNVGYSRQGFLKRT